jgi:hypothetical protein
MFIGHFAVAFIAKKKAPAISLGFLFLAAQWLDLLWPTLLVLGMERVEIDPGNTILTPLDFVHYPISHSLLMVFIWSILGMALTWWLTRNRIATVVIGTCILSHWVLDLIVHRPDLPLSFGDTALVGLGLWNHPILAIGIEALLFVGAILIYQRLTTPLNYKGRYGFLGLVLSLMAIYITSFIGPSPPDTASVALAGHLQWLFVIMAFWVDKNRTTG